MTSIRLASLTGTSMFMSATRTLRATRGRGFDRNGKSSERPHG